MRLAEEEESKRSKNGDAKSEGEGSDGDDSIERPPGNLLWREKIPEGALVAT